MEDTIKEINQQQTIKEIIKFIVSLIKNRMLIIKF